LSRRIRSRKSCYGGGLYIECLHMDLLQGTLDMLVLRALILGPLHGYGIAKALRSQSGEALEIEFGSLYPALKRLESKAWISSSWETSEHNRRAKFYKLTAAGRKQLRSEYSKWTDFVAAVGRIMGSEDGAR
jgi:PadR family transcriptional regulator PadR